MADGMTTETPRPTEYRQVRFVRPPGACEILLVRHGESEPSRPGQPFNLVDGRGDPDLDPVGRAQAERIAGRLAGEGISRIYVTNLKRTAQTAAPLLAVLGIDPIVVPELCEVHLGEWEGGLYRQRVAERDPIALRMFVEGRYDVIPGAEPREQFSARTRGAITAIATENRDATVAVFTHGGVIGQILADACGAHGFTFAGADNGSISHLVVVGDRWIIRRFNDTAHLGMGFTTAPEPLI